jgi:hypothetical protein
VHQKYSVTKSKSKTKANVNVDTNNTNVNETTMFGMQIAMKYSPIYFSIIKTIYINPNHSITSLPPPFHLLLSLH